MSIQNSDADLKAAQTPATIIDRLNIFSNTSNPTFSTPVKFTNLGFGAHFDGAVSQGPFDINNSPVGYYVDGAGNPTTSLTGRVSVMTWDDSAFSGGPSNFIVDMNGRVDELVVNLVSGGILNSFTTNQTTPLVISSFVLSNFGQCLIDAPNVTDLTFPSAVGLTYTYGLTLNGAWPSATTNALLQSFLNGGTTGTTIVIGGTSGAPIVTPEVDEITIGGLTYPIDGYSTTLTGSGGATNLYNINYDASIPFSSSTGDSYGATIGIQDSPTTAAIANFLNNNGSLGNRAVSVSGSVITISSTNRSEWPYGVASSIDTLANVSPGVDLVANLVALGNSVTTN